ncbi:hypothetical protein CANARDRAFT_195524 [[Candida] arabinofermentans NRRL YB-2248]|uniref:HIT-type domain-containing protein n=1 Tax=[Candida] arabinofermentans NRRL YB-2248 TaxID=983967 RepID=A0A1E4T4A9_9ASCO|nr:hypothetical protein CANARDRAFT_195524 [[Candida] arabinofermentans NRRL YB-2248]
MHTVEEIVKGRNPNQYFSSIYQYATPTSITNVDPTSGSGGQRTSGAKRKRINYNISALQQSNEQQQQQMQVNQAEHRKAMKRFEELNSENYNDHSKFEIPKTFHSLTPTQAKKLTTSRSTKPSVAVRRILNSKKNWSNYLDEIDKSELRYYNKLEVKPDTFRARKLCTICGNTSFSSCIKCSARVCCLKCQVTHNETRCSNY